MLDKRLGLGSNTDLRRCWCDEGLIKAASALFSISPLSALFTSEFAIIADLRAFSLFGEYGIILCKLHLNDPGCVVGEHRHVFLFRTSWSRWAADMVRFFGDTAIYSVVVVGFGFTIGGPQSFIWANISQVQCGIYSILERTCLAEVTLVD